MVRFLAVGNTSDGGEKQQIVADEMARKCKGGFCDFVLLLGDNFYPSGVSSAFDPLFETEFEIPYAELDVPFYAVLGNHDVKGNIQAQIDYSEVSGKWIMPDRYYSHAHPRENPVVELFAIDSTNFDEEQETWLSAALESSSARWKILYDHYPYFGNGPTGGNAGNIAVLAADTTCGKIDLIISGHNHVKEHLVGNTGGCVFHQITIGTGGAQLYEVYPDERTLFANSTYGFGWFSVAEDELHFEFIDEEGNVEYDHRLSKPMSGVLHQRDDVDVIWNQ